MKNILYTATFFLFANLVGYAQCTTVVKAPVVVNGISITGSGTGSFSTWGAPFSDPAICSGWTIPTNSLFLGQTGSFTYTYNFSQPITSFSFMVGATDVAESLTFVTNTGVPSISTITNCNYIVTGNVLSVASSVGYGRFTLFNPSGFTSLTISGPGLSNGTLIGICSASITLASCNAGFTAPTISPTSISNVCPATTVNLNTLHTGTIPPLPGVSLVWFTNNTHTGAAYATPSAAGAGNYYAFYYDSVNNCYSPASLRVTVTINSCCGVGLDIPILN